MNSTLCVYFLMFVIVLVIRKDTTVPSLVDGKTISPKRIARVVSPIIKRMDHGLLPYL